MLIDLINSPQKRTDSVFWCNHIVFCGMADESITELATTRIDSERWEPKPARVQCLNRECDRDASRPDGYCARHSNVRRTISANVEVAREILLKNQRRYAELHMQAATVAASKGLAEPAQWALLHGRAVEPVQRDSNGPSVIVQVGVATLPGLPGS